MTREDKNQGTVLITSMLFEFSLMKPREKSLDGELLIFTLHVGLSRIVSTASVKSLPYENHIKERYT